MTRYRPSKRVRNWYRKMKGADDLSLRRFGRAAIEADFGGVEAWKDWFKNKGTGR